MQRIILASASPRRKEILELLGVEFEVRDSGFDEERVKRNDPEELVEELALQKALVVANELEGEDVLIVGGDTLVEVQGKVLGKARDGEQAKEIIGKLSGREHRVLSGVAVVDGVTGEKKSRVGEARVRFRDLSEEEIARYAESEKWRGFAGAYALQGGAAPLIERYEGLLSVIIGMPIAETVDLLEESGVAVEVDPRELEERIKGMKVGLEEE